MENDVRYMVNPMLDRLALVFPNNMGIIMICAIIWCKIKIFLGKSRLQKHCKNFNGNERPFGLQ